MANGVVLRSLKLLNTFAVDVFAHNVAIANTEIELLTLWQESIVKNEPILLLGEGSNVLFLENFNGTVVLNRIKGIVASEDVDAWHLHVGAGELWHDLVIYTLDQNMPGLENLALIPGCVGSAPIQNIGAYGIEFHQFCEYVDVIHLVDGKRRRFSAIECQFGYRDSIFKHYFRENYAIVAVGLRLHKAWRPTLNYGELIHLDPNSITPRRIFDTVCVIRRSKIPDPKLIGNAGSFFKNPIVDANTAHRLQTLYPDAPNYLQTDGRVKFAAGWLIDHCQLKGYRIGDAAVHNNQALVLINVGQATGSDIMALAKHVHQKVAEKFSIRLESEVRLIGAEGEVVLD